MRKNMAMKRKSTATRGPAGAAVSEHDTIAEVSGTITRSYGNIVEQYGEDVWHYSDRT